ncbi:Modifier of mdg4, partial [Operophtera brumata]
MVNGAVFSLSRYGKPVVEIGGYRYNKYYTCNGPRVRWVCSKKTALKCNTYVISINDHFISI